MKKSLKGLCAIAFAFVLLLGLTGCGNNENGGTVGGNETGGNGKSFPTASFISSYFSCRSIRNRWYNNSCYTFR